MQNSFSWCIGWPTFEIVNILLYFLWTCEHVVFTWCHYLARVVTSPLRGEKTKTLSRAGQDNNVIGQKTFKQNPEKLKLGRHQWFTEHMQAWVLDSWSIPVHACSLRHKHGCHHKHEQNGFKHKKRPASRRWGGQSSAEEGARMLSHWQMLNLIFKKRPD